MRHYTRDHGPLLQDTHTEATGQQKKPVAGGAGFVWTALGLVMVTSTVRAEQMRAEICKKHDVQTNVLISPVNDFDGAFDGELIGARIYILDEDGMIMDFDTDSLEMEDISWGIDDDGNIFFLTDPTGKALIPQLDVPHQVVALEAGSDVPIYALPHFLQQGDAVIISPLTDFLARTISEKGLTELEAGDFISTYLALDAISSDFESLYTAIREEIITRIEDTRLLADQHDQKSFTMQHEYALGDDDHDITLPPAEVLLAVTVVNDAADRGRIRQQTEEQYGKDSAPQLDDLTVSVLQDQHSSAGTSPAGVPLPEETPMEELNFVDTGLMADVDTTGDSDITIYDSVSFTPDII